MTAPETVALECPCGNHLCLNSREFLVNNVPIIYHIYLQGCLLNE
jgi:hypothetical protein